MTQESSGYVAFITGGSSGIGYEMARQLLADGASVIVTARGGQRLEEARKSLSAFGDVHALTMDVRDEASVSEAAEWVRNRFGRVDMVVSNAGIGNNAPGIEELPENVMFWDIPTSVFKNVIDTNLTGHFLVARRFVPLMIRQGHGSLVYVSTSTATMTRPGQIPYGPSKAGAEAMTAIMADALKDLGIMVNVICPGGFTDTAMAGRGQKERFLKSGGTVLPPTVLNRTISFLASPASAGIWGEKIVGKEFDEWLRKKGIAFG